MNTNGVSGATGNGKTTGEGTCAAPLPDDLAALRSDLRRAGYVLGSIAARQISRWAPAVARERGLAMAVDGQCAPGIAFSAASRIHAGAEGGGAGWSFDVKRTRKAQGGFTVTFSARPMSPSVETQHA